MANPYHHSVSSSKKYGGTPEDYQAIHDWFDDTKSHYAFQNHRALKHHSLGCYWCEEKFGKTITISTGKKIPTRWIAEQHIREDLGFIPTVKDWFENLATPKWAMRGSKL
tara:strand:+ start:1423 stop:1752 length:330 start_codon:yes stop_codon:yes gene_type:complete